MGLLQQLALGELVLPAPRAAGGGRARFTAFGPEEGEEEGGEEGGGEIPPAIEEELGKLVNRDCTSRKQLR